MKTLGTQGVLDQAPLLERMDASSKVEAMAKISEATTWTKNPHDSLKRVATALSEELGADNATLFLLTSTGESLIEHASSNYDFMLQNEIRRIPLRTGRTYDLITNKKPIFSNYGTPFEEDTIPESTSKSGFLCAASIPLVSRDGAIGMYCLSFKELINWDKADVEFLMAVGRMLGVIIRNAQQASNCTELEVLIERKRLSTEIHDNLSQLASILKLEAESAKMLFEEGNEEMASREMSRLILTSKQMLKTLREEILYLRAPTFQSQGLVFGIEECLSRFNERWDITIELRVEDINQPIIVSTYVELQLTRIVHEALSNTFRHAGATEVLIVISGDDKKLIMQISDDGCGFDPDSVSPERMGLTIMNERAGSIGGTLTVDSADNSGTIVRVEVPRDPY